MLKQNNYHPISKALKFFILFLTFFISFTESVTATNAPSDIKGHWAGHSIQK